MLKLRPGGGKAERRNMAEHHWIYILELANGAYYTGYTADLEKRYRLHLAGRASRYTRSFKPVRIAQCWQLAAGRGEAMKVEACIKKRGRKVKETLIANPGKLAALAHAATGLELQVFAAPDLAAWSAAAPAASAGPAGEKPLHPGTS